LRDSASIVVNFCPAERMSCHGAQIQDATKQSFAEFHGNFFQLNSPIPNARWAFGIRKYRPYNRGYLLMWAARSTSNQTAALCIES